MSDTCCLMLPSWDSEVEAEVEVETCVYPHGRGDRVRVFRVPLLPARGSGLLVLLRATLALGWGAGARVDLRLDDVQMGGRAMILAEFDLY